MASAATGTSVRNLAGLSPDGYVRSWRLQTFDDAAVIGGT